MPEFEIGIIREDDDVFPDSVLEKPDGRPLSEIPEVLEEDDWRKKFGELNDKGKTLSDMNRILYPIERRNEDVLINPERDEMTYINPGTFNQEALFNQFSKSDEVPSNRMVLADWLSESFWKQKMM